MNGLLYFAAVDITPGKYDGVAKKVIAQCRAFDTHLDGCDVFLASFVGERFAVRKYDANENEFAFVDLGSSSQRKMRLKVAYDYLARFVKQMGIKSIYFRSPGLGIFSHTFFKSMRKSGASIIVEIPTWPFWPEKRREIVSTARRNPLKGVLKLVGAIDYWLESKRLRGLVDSLVTYSDLNELWGIPVFGISNGYDFSSVSALRHVGGHEEIRLVTAATLRRNHGIDRMIRSLAAYSGDRRVVFHIAGEGDASSELRALSDDLGLLDKTVFFHGYLFGDDLLSLYSRCDVGVSALGFHRYGVFKCSPLKTKEYLALGLPCIGTEAEWDIMGSQAADYFLSVHSDESLIDLKKVVSFVDHMRIERTTPEDVRNAGESSFDWKVIMRPIANRFKQLEGEAL